MGLKIAGALSFGGLIGLFASQASAQQVGTYSGSQANGAPISITVEQHKTSLYLSGVGIGIMTTCPDGEAVNENVGLGIEPIKIDRPKFDFKLLANPELYVAASMKFDNATQSVAGTITAIVPALDEFTKHPKKSETCISKQGFTATLGAPEGVQAKPPKMVIY
jgi:hypothetical protein